MRRMSAFLALTFVLVLAGAARGQTTPVLIAQIDQSEVASGSGEFPPTTGTRFQLGYENGPTISSPLMPSPLVLSNTEFLLDATNTHGFADLVSFLTDGVPQQQMQTRFLGVVEPGTPYGEGIGGWGSGPETAKLGRTRDLQGFDVAFIRLVVAHAAATFSPYSIDVQATWEIWGTAVNNHPPTADAGPDQTLVAAGSYATVVSLGGSGVDPDGDPLTFVWTGAFGVTSGPNAAVALLPGVYDIMLTVNDDRFGSSSDTVRITVRDAIAELSAQIANQCSQSQGGGDIATALAGLTSQVAQCQQLISAGQSQLAARDVQLATAQTQVESLNQQVVHLSQQLATLSALVDALEHEYRRIRPSFHFPRETAVENLHELITVLLAQSAGQKTQIISGF